MKAIRQQVKENFQNMEFSKAMEVNIKLKDEYIRVYGQRSWISLANYYSKKAKEQTKAEVQEETVAEQPEVQEPVAEVQESPMMKQWHELKEKHPDALLLFRVGDFYETYQQDAEDTEDLPEINRKVIVLCECEQKEVSYVCFGHRPDPKSWIGKPLIYGKGGWNIPDVRWWLDADLPKEYEK